MKARRDRALRTLYLVLIACATLPASLYLYASWANYNSAFELADEDISRALDIAAGHAQAVFQSVDVTMNSVEQITRGRSSESLRSEESELNARLKEMRAAIPDIESIWLFDATGYPIASSLLIPVPPDLDTSTRDFFVSQRDVDPQYFLGQQAAHRRYRQVQRRDGGLDPARRFRILFCRHRPGDKREPCADSRRWVAVGAISGAGQRRHQARFDFGIRRPDFARAAGRALHRGFRDR